ncbi:hypothetical protein [Legionella maioricensis]|uniref:Uncharacterized protein n=1 Tax=Legionella maioricensis TaxID=2896528 RepID=A0A9X2D3H4_9GAMM|nr:hypothetical protein [Legionella maioricensis]MCL9685679.1 hypothetical protein [Legionella maioricensis]MCL9689099.1 hypothetical protein [Legionella maioricensis]
MKLTDLIEQFPWANYPLARPFAEFFSKEQWSDLTSAGVGELIKKNKISDKNLLKLLKDIHEVANYPHVIESFKSGEHSFKDLVTFQVEEISQKHESSDQIDGSEIQYLLVNGFERNVLDGLFAALDLEVAVEHVCVAGKILAQPKMTPEEKKDELQSYWKLSIYPHNLFCKSKTLPSEVLNYLAEELTYEQFTSTANSKESALFKPSPSKLEFEKFKKESLALASFANHCLKFIEAIELRNEADNGSTLVI